MKLVFIGTGGAFTVGGNYNSNMLFEADSGKKLLIDCGSDARHALYELGLDHSDIDAVYISHLHADHIGGLEWLAFKTKFDPNIDRKVPLYAGASLIEPIWHSLEGGLSSLQDVKAQFSTFFDVQPVPESGYFTWEGYDFHIFKTIHMISNGIVIPSFGIQTVVNNVNVLLSTDTIFPKNEDDPLHELYKVADVIFHDCETGPGKSTVHAHYTELMTLSDEIKSKMWLYHYQPGPLPDAKKDGFIGFVPKGGIFDFQKPETFLPNLKKFKHL